MAIDWAGLGANHEYLDDFTGLSVYSYTTAVTGDFIFVELRGIVQMFQRMLGQKNSDKMEPDGGYFKAVRQSDQMALLPPEICTRYFSQSGSTRVWGDADHASYRLAPVPVAGNIPGAEPYANSRPWPGYVTPWVASSQGGAGAYDADCYMWFNSRFAGTFDIIHVRPWAWKGTLAQVLAAACMKTIDNLQAPAVPTMAAADDWINQVEFDRTESAHTQEMFVYLRTGQSLADLAKRMVQHTVKATLTFDMQGKIALVNHESPYASTSNPQADDLQLLKPLKVVHDDRYVCNKASFRVGSASLVQGGGLIIAPEYAYPSNRRDRSAEWQSPLRADIEGHWRVDAENLKSQYAYGTIWLKGTQETTEERSENNDAILPDITRRQVKNMPYFLDVADVQEHVDAIESTSSPYPPDAHVPRVVTSVQTMMGLQFDVGHVITTWYNGIGGSSITKAVKETMTIDFDAETVTSTWVERNTGLDFP